MVGRAGCSTQALHLLNQEGNQCAGVLDAGLGLLIEVCLVGRSATLGNHQEAVLHTLGCLNVNLCGQVALGVHLIVHIQRSVLAVAQVLLGISLVNAL